MDVPRTAGNWGGEGGRKRDIPSNCVYKFRVLFSLPASSWSARPRSPAATNFGFTDRDKTGIFINEREPPRAVAKFLIFTLHQGLTSRPDITPRHSDAGR